MEIALGALVALAYGSGDFLGGISAKGLPTVAVLLVSQSFGLAAAVVLVVALRDAPPAAHIFVLSAAAGVVAVMALGLLFRGLAVGRMSIVAPLSAIGGGVLPVAWGLLRGERPSALALAGVGVALVAAAIVGRGAEHDPAPAISPRLELALGAGAGVGFGVVFILLAESSSGSGMWPVVIARCASVPVLAVAAVVLGSSPRMARAEIAPVAGAGLFDVGANALVVLAVRRGLLSLVAPVASLYPATTVVLARLVLHERVGRQRAGGLALGLVGLALIATR
ncbi:MAG TPA: EamA family transporter [Acidimicrobiia bacterium]|nr:EamA family transporter [Acidimicrobiia bacterium]